MQCAFELDGICYISSAVQYSRGRLLQIHEFKIKEEKRESKK
jgi:hypothetical protein